ncbi:MAG: hypothetical protein KAI66_01130, partial [Lentisphaeria bacterium]|nr:hypothetical protein [Lentisphaeria bacterium]
MQTIHPLLPTDALGNARFAIFMSGSGSNAEKILIQIREQSSDPGFRAVALVTDAPETSRTRELGQQYGLPVVECDIRAFYKARGEARVSIATETGGRIRAEWTNELRTLLAPLDIHFAVFAGFVPLT